MIDIYRARRIDNKEAESKKMHLRWSARVAQFCSTKHVNSAPYDLLAVRYKSEH